MIVIQEINSGSMSTYPWFGLALYIISFRSIYGVYWFSYIPRIANELANKLGTTQSLLDNFSIILSCHLLFVTNCFINESFEVWQANDEGAKNVPA